MKLTLRQWRGAKELTQREMSERLNVHINTYQKWEENPGSIKITDAKHISEQEDEQAGVARLSWRVSV